MSKFQDREYLQTSQYRTSSNLTARADLHGRFTVSAEGWPEWVLAHVALGSGEHILECGAGPGWLWEPLDELPDGCRLILTDLSAGMVTEANGRLTATRDRISVATADIQNIPFPNQYFDVVVANHMLYHVPDLTRALAEVTRVLQPDGRFVAATNGRGHLHELFELSSEVFPAAPTTLHSAMHTLPFALENGADLLSSFFDRVELFQYDSYLAVDDAEALVNYMFSSAEAQAAVSSEERVAGIAVLQERILEDGPIHISKQTGLYIAQSPKIVA